MTRQTHDRFAKQYLAKLLAPLGAVEISRQVVREFESFEAEVEFLHNRQCVNIVQLNPPIQVDVWFVPAPQPATAPQILGLLGQMVSNHCLLEPFRDRPSASDIRNCLTKLFSLNNELQQKAQSENAELAEDSLPMLWILANDVSAELIDGFGAAIAPDKWPIGVYFLAELFKTAIVAIDQLPPTPQTLWLRILGKGATQQQAISELIALPKEHPLRSNVLEMISSWRITLEKEEISRSVDRELIMNLSPAYLE